MKAFAIVSIVVSAIVVICDIYGVIKKAKETCFSRYVFWRRRFAF